MGGWKKQGKAGRELLFLPNCSSLQSCLVLCAPADLPRNWARQLARCCWCSLPWCRWQGSVHRDPEQPCQCMLPTVNHKGTLPSWGHLGAYNSPICKHPLPRAVTNISAHESGSGFLSTRSNRLQSKSLCCTTCHSVLKTPGTCGWVPVHIPACHGAHRLALCRTVAKYCLVPGAT